MEVAQTHQVVPVVEQTQPSSARFLARTLADSIGFGEEDSYRVGLVATELATNLVKHAQGGELLASVVASSAGQPTLELIAVDRGPGIRDVALAMRDGHSTAGSSGQGLGAIRRLSDTFDVHSSEGRGTVVLARVAPRKRGAANAPFRFECAGVSVAKAGEPVCGDSWAAREFDDHISVAVADGLGHGLHAADAANACTAAFGRTATAGPMRILEAMHDAARPTRGAAAAVALVNGRTGALTFAGVGNIAGSILAPGQPLRHTVSQPGTLGHQARGLREYAYPWTAESLLVMHSDGLASHWTFDGLETLARRHPAVVAAVLYREFSRHRDDVTVVVARMRT